MNVFSPFFGDDLKWHRVHPILIVCRHNGMFCGVLTPISITLVDFMCISSQQLMLTFFFYPSLHLVSCPSFPFFRDFHDSRSL